MSEKIETLRDILDDIRTVMLVDRFQGGMRARPMALHFDDDTDEALWFVTDTASGKIGEVMQNPEVCVSVQSGNTYASVSGTAEMVEDRAKLKDIWNVFVGAWYPEGPESPSVTLLKVTPKHGEYWKGDSTVVAGVKMLLASARDERPNIGENEKVRFS